MTKSANDNNDDEKIYSYINRLMNTWSDKGFIEVFNITDGESEQAEEVFNNCIENIKQLITSAEKRVAEEIYNTEDAICRLQRKHLGPTIISHKDAVGVEEKLKQFIEYRNTLRKKYITEEPGEKGES